MGSLAPPYHGGRMQVSPAGDEPLLDVTFAHAGVKLVAPALTERAHAQDVFVAALAGRASPAAAMALGTDDAWCGSVWLTTEEWESASAPAGAAHAVAVVARVRGQARIARSSHHARGGAEKLGNSCVGQVVGTMNQVRPDCRWGSTWSRSTPTSSVASPTRPPA